MQPTSASQPARQTIAVVGAGIAGLACARTLAQAGHQVHVFEQSPGFGGRLATRRSPFGTFDHGVQYFTVRDVRFGRAIATAPGTVRPWSANAVRVLDPHGRQAEAALPTREPHYVGTPGMNELARAWASPLVQADAITLQTQVTRIERDALDRHRWQLRTSGPGEAAQVRGGFDAVLLAIPAPQAQALLATSGVAEALAQPLDDVVIAPCWAMMLAYPQAMQPTLAHLGPQWNAALSTHNRIAWLARESSKPGRDPVERWTIQASAAWSREHLDDGAARVQAKLLRAFAEITGIRAEPAHCDIHRWLHAKTEVPLGKPFLWDARRRIGLCGDWCLGHRVENAFVSGLELALKVA